ncbi:MAG: DUF4136 domain-containing protein [Opitutaceae bacterium]|nr:DUF4136 domain-containing protein [Opitutaceae bacterium]
MKKQMLSLAGLAAALVLAACTTAPKFNSEFKKDADFTKYKTYTVVPLPQKVEGMDPGAGIRLSSAALGSAKTAMGAKGYTESAVAKEADVALIIKGKSVPKTDITDWGFSYGVGWGGYPYAGGYYGSNISVDQYDEGTLIVEAYDVKTKAMIWVGWVTGRVQEKTDGQAERVANAVAQVLGSYPAVGQQPMPPVGKK